MSGLCTDGFHLECPRARPAPGGWRECHCPCHHGPA